MPASAVPSVADQVAHLAHLNARDTTLVFASRAPQTDIARLKARMGWEIPWYTITDSFDADFGVDEWHGHNAFIRDGERVFRTYFINSRGDEAMGTTWSYLDMTALGRQEEWEDSPEGYPQTPTVQVVELARQLRRRGLARSEVGRGVGRRRGHFPETRRLARDAGREILRDELPGERSRSSRQRVIGSHRRRELRERLGGQLLRPRGVSASLFHIDLCEQSQTEPVRRLPGYRELARERTCFGCTGRPQRSSSPDCNSQRAEPCERDDLVRDDACSCA